MTVMEEKTSSWSSRLSFFRTKRAIAGISVLAIVSIVLIVLGATNTIGPNRGGGDSDEQSSSTDQDDTATPSDTWQPDNSSTIADGTPLRIMSLGASLVRGEASTTLTGFRSTLRDELVKLGVDVNMVGSQRFGDMLDNDLEAYGGKRVSESFEYATRVAPQTRPNLFVLQVGTNNALQDRDVDAAGRHMEDFINYLLDASPRSTVVFSTCLTNIIPDIEPRILDINRQYRALAAKFQDKPVLLAEMHPSEGQPNRPQPSDIGEDGTHPTDYGYDLMAYIFLDSIKEADSKGYLRWPEANGLAYDGDAGRAEETVTTTELPPTATARRRDRR